MKRALKISVAANLVLVAVALALARRRAGTEKDPAPRDPASAAIATESVAAPQWPRPEPESFRWSQVESTAYPTYIANLRRIGCPEQTIRDIIVADVHSLYAQRCQELERKHAELGRNPTATGLSDGQSLAAELQRMRDEEATVIAALLPPQDGRPPAEIATSSQTERHRALDRIVAIPLAFQNIDPAAMRLDGHQIEVMSDLRQKFREALGGPDPNPNDPAYRKRWQEAQRENDDLVSGLLGGQFFLDYQMQAASASPQSQ